MGKRQRQGGAAGWKWSAAKGNVGGGGYIRQDEEWSVWHRSKEERGDFTN